MGMKQVYQARNGGKSATAHFSTVHGGVANPTAGMPWEKKYEGDSTWSKKAGGGVNPKNFNKNTGEVGKGGEGAERDKDHTGEDRGWQYKISSC